MSIIWRTPERLKANFLMYTAPGMSGGKVAVRLTLKGRRGDPGPSSISSMVIRAPLGTTVILMTHPGPDWEQHTWRAVRLLPNCTVPGKKTPTPGVRVPDLDFLDEFDAKAPGKGMRESYPLVKRFADGRGWTFGRCGDEELTRNVHGIMVLAPGLTPDGVVIGEGSAAPVAAGSAAKAASKPKSASKVKSRSKPTPVAVSSTKSVAKRPDVVTTASGKRVFFKKPKPIVE